jgi:hypothetical protein
MWNPLLNYFLRFMILQKNWHADSLFSMQSSLGNLFDQNKKYSRLPDFLRINPPNPTLTSRESKVAEKIKNK